jgi:5-oxoprolinase (ATP-hydrolysing)
LPRRGFAQVSVSHEVSPLIKLVGRGDTTVVDAYLSPILAPLCRARSPRSSDAPARRAADVHDVLGRADRRRPLSRARTPSCPARPAAWSAWRDRRGSPASSKVIGFDMGGTSTDVAHFDGEYERAFDTEVAGVRMRAPMMRIHTVAAGGGSILHFDGATLPRRPGFRRRQSRPRLLPARRAARGHRRKRHDWANCVPTSSPQSSARTNNQAARRQRRPRKIREAGARIGGGKKPEEIADGFITIAVENMANAIKKISVQRGYDVTALCAELLRRRGRPACLSRRRQRSA